MRPCVRIRPCYFFFARSHLFGFRCRIMTSPTTGPLSPRPLPPLRPRRRRRPSLSPSELTRTMQHLRETQALRTSQHPQHRTCRQRRSSKTCEASTAAGRRGRARCTALADECQRLAPQRDGPRTDTCAQHSGLRSYALRLCTRARRCSLRLYIPACALHPSACAPIPWVLPAYAPSAPVRHLLCALRLLVHRARSRLALVRASTRPLRVRAA